MTSFMLFSLYQCATYERATVGCTANFQPCADLLGSILHDVESYAMSAFKLAIKPNAIILDA